MKKIHKLYISQTSDPYLNLAIEDQILKSLSAKECALLVYRNTSSVVMGRFQNPWIEVNIEKMKELGVELVRRQSGGGCVYHDMGNLNFCFLYGEKDYKKAENNAFLVKLLEHFQIKARVNERSDLVLDLDKCYKFSGSAFKQKKDRSFHHCTFLLNTDLSNLGDILDSPLKHLKSKSTPSKRSHVMNLQKLNPDLSFETIIEFLTIHAEKTLKISDVVENEYLNFLTSWNWMYGETPLFEIQLNIDDLVLELQIRKARILSSAFTSYPTEQENKQRKINDILEGAHLRDSSQTIRELAEVSDLGERVIIGLKEAHLF